MKEYFENIDLENITLATILDAFVAFLTCIVHAFINFIGGEEESK